MSTPTGAPWVEGDWIRHRHLEHRRGRVLGALHTGEGWLITYEVATPYRPYTIADLATDLIESTPSVEKP